SWHTNSPPDHAYVGGTVICQDFAHVKLATYLLRIALSVRRMAVLWAFRAPALCRPLHRELMRSGLLDLTSIIPVTACHQRNYVERYSRSTLGLGFQAPEGHPKLGMTALTPALRRCQLSPPPALSGADRSLEPRQSSA